MKYSKPPFRKLRGYAFDPSLSLQVDTALINNITYKIPWEENLQPGPMGEYLEVIDYDPTVKKWYSPVNLDDLFIVAQDGLAPSSSNPQFHQQMVYAVAMTTIKNFEAALGRPVLWSARRVKKQEGKSDEAGANINKSEHKKWTEDYVGTLRIYPHALRDANAFYSPQKKALLFGYFSARPVDIKLQMPENLTFTCLSHDVIAHETTHAILDGLFRKYTEDTNPDVLAFHEAFADIVALFQHFTFPEALKNQIAATRGDLTSQNLLGKLAQEFGIAIGNYGSLRDAIGYFDSKTKEWKPQIPTGNEYQEATEPHARGAVLVSAVFDAFLKIYKTRVADLLRIASNGTGVLVQGELQPDLVNRLASEASKTAGHVLKMCIRALDYCPPVDITFGDFLRAIITADIDLVTDDNRDYRLSFIDAFRKRGIYPSGIKSLSVESLTYTLPSTKGMEEEINILTTFLREFRSEITYVKDRELIYNLKKKYIAGKYVDQDGNRLNGKDITLGLHRRFNIKFQNSEEFEKLTGLVFNHDFKLFGIHPSWASANNSSFEVQSLHYASRMGPDGIQVNQVILTLVQKAYLHVQKADDGNVSFIAKVHGGEFQLTGGCTLIFDLDSLILKHVINKPLLDTAALGNYGTRQISFARLSELYKYRNGHSHPITAYQAYFGLPSKIGTDEPFAFLHTH